ncbi:GerAB/ArcD/ProY family transporter [Petroclostridium sp. X23]|uniref:GerAB/ArcD/ProY family transporter n=1 Tax=Petroclostridium sp. X23 TaxID=3045146 RepID=UPI0024AE2380|nr:GerAB/ArcD/ProY family transporter [Petroclostridium sp. X23]WHH57829.1 GerAB/ArcD/ProY family transporter [Petroclostridium sp. X23]
MLADREKISLRQAALLFLTLAYSPAVRFIPLYVANRAKQASWLAPCLASIFFVILVYILHRFFKQHKNHSLMDVIYSVLGLGIGRVVVIIYMIWITLLLALNVRYYGEKIVSSILPNTVISVFLIIMLGLLAYVLRSGLVVIARMNEIIFYLITISTLLMIFFLLPVIKVNDITPVSYKDIYPLFEASIGVTGIWVYFFFLFFLGNKINNKEKIKNIGIQTLMFLLIANIATIIATVGTLGYSVTGRIPLPFLTAVKQISVFDIFEKVESIVVMIWIASDFILFSVFTYCVLLMIKSVFRLSEYKVFINIYMVFIYFLAMYICNSVFELQSFAENVVVYVNIFLGVFIPIVILIIGEIRKKI